MLCFLKKTSVRLTGRGVVLPKSVFDRPADALLESLIDQVQWTQNTIRFYGKESRPEMEAWYGMQAVLLLRHPHGTKTLDREILEIKKAVEPIAGIGLIPF